MSEPVTPKTERRSQVARMQPLLLRVEDAAEALGIGRTQVYYLIRDEKLASVKIGKRRLIRPEDIAAYRATLSADGAA